VAAPEILQHLGRLSCRQMPDGGWQHKFDRNIYAQQRVMDPYAYWERVKMPAMLMKAALSVRVTKEIAAEAKKRCPQMELVEVPDCHHHITIDNPAGYVRAVKVFLAKHA